jgi:hypothetical protein
MTTVELFTLIEPVPFEGTPEQARANFDSHSFSNPDGVCLRCDSALWFTSASYPCGAEIPRQERTVFSDGTETIKPINESGNQ